MRLATRLKTSSISLADLARLLTPPALWEPIYRRMIIGAIPHAERYRPRYSPWLAPDFQALYREIRPYALASIDRCWTLSQMLAQALNVGGDVMEAGVFRGGTARLLKLGMAAARDRSLLLFDSFEGMETVSATADRHRRGDFAETSLDAVRAVVGVEPFIDYRKGWIPATFAGLEQRTFCFAHIDLDLYQSILDCLEFLYPRMLRGAVIVFDKVSISFEGNTVLDEISFQLHL